MRIRNKACVGLLTVLLGVSPTFADLPMILRAIRLQESGGKNNPRDGDGGDAIGVYQIHREYYEDVRGFVGGTYEDCRNPAFAEKVVRAYFNKYCPNAVKTNNYEVMARVHNGGPKGYKNPKTYGYWIKVRKFLRS